MEKKIPFNTKVAKQWRKKAGLTNKKIADILGLREDTVKQMFRTGMITRDNLDKLGSALGIDPDYLSSERLEKPKSDSEKSLFQQMDRIDSDGYIILGYGGKMKNRLHAFHKYMTLLGERGIEDIDAVHNWKSDKVMNMCDASFEFRFTQYMLPFLKAEGFLPTLPSREANITEGE